MTTTTLPTIYLDSPDSVRISYDGDEPYFPYTMIVQGSTSLASDAASSERGPNIHLEASFTREEMARLVKSVTL
jgi:hypothetical protein